MTEAELRRLRDYVDWVQRGATFTPEEATDFRDLSVRVAEERPGEDWVVELLKVSLFVYALDVVGDALAPRESA